MRSNGHTLYHREKTAADAAAVDDLRTLADQSKRVLLEIKSVFPFDFFPDSIILDELKVTIHQKIFFWSKMAYSVEYEDIFNVSVEHNILFANFTIEDRFFVQRPISVRFLWKNDAILARRVIQGMILAKRAKVDLGNVNNTEELLSLTEKIGKAY